MAQRGRGTLEIRESNNPFFQTTNGLIGMNLEEEKDQWSAPPVARLKPQKEGEVSASSFAFLYSRESERWGEGVAIGENNKLSKILQEKPSRAEIVAARGRGLNPSGEEPFTEADAMGYTDAPTDVRAEDVLEHYDHDTKEEDPRYTTSSNEIGRQRPTPATLVVSRRARPQGFSSSFQGGRQKDSSLNTGLTKSTVHPALDPQFM